MAGLFGLGSRSSNAQVVASLNVPCPESGGTYIGDTSLYPAAAAVPPFQGYCAIYAVTDTVLNAASQHNIAGLNGVTIKAGTWVYAIFTQIKLTSGTIIAYNAVPQS